MCQNLPGKSTILFTLALRTKTNKQTKTETPKNRRLATVTMRPELLRQQLRLFQMSPRFFPLSLGINTFRSECHVTYFADVKSICYRSLTESQITRWKRTNCGDNACVKFKAAGTGPDRYTIFSRKKYGLGLYSKASSKLD